MTTITSLTRATPAAPAPAPAASPTPAINSSGAVGSPSSTIVALSDGTAASPPQALVWENHTRSTSSALMAQNFANQSGASRLKGLGAELLKQVAYDGKDFAQTVQAAPDGVQANTYDMLVSPVQLAQHGMGDNQFDLTVTTKSGVKVDLKLDAGDSSIAVEAHANGDLSDTERDALGKLADAFQKSIDGLSDNPPRIDLSGLTQFDSSALSAIDLKGQVKVNGNDTQSLTFHADAAKRSVSFNGPAGTAQIGVDLSQPTSWGSKDQQAKALNNYLQQVDQAGQRGQGNGALVAMFKDAFTDMNSNYAAPAKAPAGIVLSKQDQAMTTGLADFNASMSQTPVPSNPARPSEKDTFAYDVSQKTTISGNSQMNRSVSQQQQSHLYAHYHAPVSADSRLDLDLRPASQNYKYITIDDSASSSTDIAYDKGALTKATLQMQASQSTRTMKYLVGKLTDDQTSPSAKTVTQDLLTTLEPERIGLPQLTDAQREQTLADINHRIFLQSSPNALPNELH